MRTSAGFYGVLFLVLLAPPVLAHSGSGVHSPNVADAHHVPEAPIRGNPVTIHLTVENDTRIESVRAVYCRVQRYACAPALQLVHSGPGLYDGRIPWTSGFFQDVATVGYKFDIRYLDGTNESTPVSHYPFRPVDLPPGADTYYYYTLEAAPESPSLGPVWILLLALVPLAWRRRN